MAYAYLDKNSEDTKFYRPPYVPQKAPADTTGSTTGATGSTTSNTGSTGGIYDRLLRQQQQSAERERRARQQAIDKQAGYQSGQARDAAAGSRTNEYIYNEMANRDMGQQASLMGLGGLSESSITGQRANYQNNLSGIDRNLNTELGSIENQRAQGALGADKDYNTILRQLSQDRAQSELQSMARQQGSGVTSGSSGIASSSEVGGTNANVNKKPTAPATLSPIQQQRAQTWIDKATSNQSKMSYTSSKAQLDDIISVLGQVYASGQLDEAEVEFISKYYGFIPSFTQ